MSTWEPLRHRIYRNLWAAQFVANVGTWAQTVGAQWLMGDLGGNAFQVALVQTAITIPVFVLVVPAGTLGDGLDRRRLLLASQAFMFGGSALLATLTAAGAIGPTSLLVVIALVGVGVALAMPTFAAVQPELVPREAIPQAALLNGANLNVARALGPALGGALIAWAGPASTFALNAVSLVGVATVLYRWPREREERPLGSENIGAAMVAGARYVRSAPAFRTVLARSLEFSFCSAALWALLPLIARDRLDLGAGGYGLLLASVGVGAVLGAFAIPVARGRAQTNAVVALGAVAFAASQIGIGLSTSPWPTAALLAVGGLAFIAVTSSLSACAQVLLPAWTRARGLAYFILTFMAGQAFGSLAWGALAGAVGLSTTFVAAGVLTLAGPIIGLRALALHPAGDVRPARHWPHPNVVVDIDPDAGPVLVTVEWRVGDGAAPSFLEAMQAVAQSRRRTGARLWGLFQDGADPSLFLETFVVASWQEHLRQHVERGTVRDQELEAGARLQAEADSPSVRHLLWAYGNRSSTRR